MFILVILAFNKYIFNENLFKIEHMLGPQFPTDKQMSIIS